MRFRVPLESERECAMQAVPRGEWGAVPRELRRAMETSEVSARYRAVLGCGESDRPSGRRIVGVSRGLVARSARQEPAQRVVEVDNLERCQLLGVAYSGRHFTYLMSHGVASKTDSFVGCTTNPVRDVCHHNLKLTADRNTCSAAPHWQLDAVLGPFLCRELATDCGLSLVTGTRGKIPKRKKAPCLSAFYNVPIFTYTKRLAPRLFPALLRTFADPQFAALYQSERRTGALDSGGGGGEQEQELVESMDVCL